MLHGGRTMINLNSQHNPALINLSRSILFPFLKCLVSIILSFVNLFYIVFIIVILKVSVTSSHIYLFIYLFIEIYLYRVACSVYKTVFQQGPDKYTNKQNNKE